MNLVLTGGGSAGHTVPHLALLSGLRKYFDNIYYIGTDGIEKQIISKVGVDFYQISCPKLIRHFSFKNFKIPFSLIKSIKAAREILKALSPDAVFSKGGYVALPVVIAARSLKIPVIAHESDLSVGLANKLSTRFCKCVYTSFYQTSLKLPNGKYSGPPVREELFLAKKTAAKNLYGFMGSKKTVLVLGGGNGSKAINSCIRNNLEHFTKHFNLIHICGKGNFFGADNQGYREFEYVDDMASAYAACDYVVSRAGSNTIFEIVLLRKPSILIPLPTNASRGDQIENAEYFRKAGLCKVLTQENLSADTLLFHLKSLKDDQKLQAELKSGKIKSGNFTLINGIVDAASNRHITKKG